MSLLKTYECHFVFEAIFGYQSNYTLFAVDTIEYKCCLRCYNDRLHFTRIIVFQFYFLLHSAKYYFFLSILTFKYHNQGRSLYDSLSNLFFIPPILDSIFMFQWALDKGLFFVPSFKYYGIRLLFSKDRQEIFLIWRWWFLN